MLGFWKPARLELTMIGPIYFPKSMFVCHSSSLTWNFLFWRVHPHQELLQLHQKPHQRCQQLHQLCQRKQYGVCPSQEYQMPSCKQMWIMFVDMGTIVGQYNQGERVLNQTPWFHMLPMPWILSTKLLAGIHGTAISHKQQPYHLLVQVSFILIAYT